MKKAVVLGHFAFGHDKPNGQTIKTKVIGNELRRVFGEDEVDFEDTMGGWRFLLRLPAVALRMLGSHHDVIFLPAYKGVRVIVPLLVFLNRFFHRRLHYVVIGGWLPDYIPKYPILRHSLRRLHGIYVETDFMLKAITPSGLTNVRVMPNCKALKLAGLKNDAQRESQPLRLCTFSRILRTKGIGEAVEAVNACNRKAGKIIFTLDIYGAIEEAEWFSALMEKQPQEIQYRGVIPYDKSTDTLQAYFAMLFPTSYPGEGFAGTIIDALAAGLPTIASNWRSNGELIAEGETGRLFPTGDVDALSALLWQIAQDPGTITAMRPNCLRKAAEYQPQRIIKLLTDQMA